MIADPERRVHRIMDKQHVDEKEAREIMERVDNSRENYTKTFAGTSRYDARNYDLVINVSPFTTDHVAHFLAENVRLKYPAE